MFPGKVCGLEDYDRGTEMACVYLHSAAVRAASLKYPSVLRKGVDSDVKVQRFSSSPQLKHLLGHWSAPAAGMLRSHPCTRSRGARFAVEAPLTLAASVLFSLQ